MNGSNTIEYQPVEAYGVMPMNNDIISGGFGDNVTVTQGVTFIWYYDPNDQTNGGGFTGKGWFCGEDNTPLANKNLEELLTSFRNGSKTNLDDEFEAWQSVVNSQGPDTDYVKDFMEMVGFNCFTTRDS